MRPPTPWPFASLRTAKLRLPGDERDRERDRHRADREPADRVELDRRLERLDDRVADDLDAVAAERHLPAVEVPVRGAAGGRA